MEEEKQKSYRMRYVVCILIVLVAFVGFALRLADWQLVHGEEYRSLANRTYTHTVRVDAPRGEILDVNGVNLAINTTGYRIVFDKTYLKGGSENDIILTLTKLLDRRGEGWTDKLPIVWSGGEYVFLSEAEQAVDSLKSFLRLQSYATAQNCIDSLAERYDCLGYSPEDIRAVASVRYNMERSGFSVSTPYVFAGGVSQDTVSIVLENQQRMPGVTVQTSSTRKYVNGTVAPHVVGTIGAISQEEYDARKEDGYALNDIIGKSGIERALETYLRGTNGEKVVETTSAGAQVGVNYTENAVAGNTVYLTIDARLQAVANKALAENIQAAQESGKKRVEQTGTRHNGEDCVSGSVVVLDVRDFSVLAAASHPNYDLSQYMGNSSYYVSLLNNEAAPLFNRTLNGTYSPGSTMKLAVASGALEEGIITENTVLPCNFGYHLDGMTFNCMYYHGPLSMNRAITVSCNSFFFETGRRLGIDNLNLYARRFGLGEPTGVEIYENTGILAGREERQASGGQWYPADTIQAAIGQSDNLFTPMQIAVYAATVANGGNRYRAHFVRKVTDYTREKVIFENDPQNPTLVENVGVSAENMELVRQGMRSVVSSVSGTAYYAFANYGVTVAAKTGTAENSGSDHTIFIAFAPYEKPEIAVAVVLEHGFTSIWPQRITKAIFDAYFFGIGMEGLAENDYDLLKVSSEASPETASSGNTASESASPVSGNTPSRAASSGAAGR